MNIDLLSIIIIVLIIIVSYRIYYTSDIFQLKCIISDVDGERYCVRERNKLSLAADKLANVNKNMKLVVEYCSKNFPNNENIIR